MYSILFTKTLFEKSPSVVMGKTSEQKANSTSFIGLASYGRTKMKRTTEALIAAVIFGLAGCDSQDQSLVNQKASSPEPAEVVLVSMAGWTQTAETMERIERAMIHRISGCLPNYRITVKRRLLGLLPEGDSELFLALEYEGWKQKKKTPAGQNNLFIAVGHSSGATAIYSLLRNGSFENGPNAPAFLGLVDMALPLGPHDLTGKITHDGARQTTIVHYHTPDMDRIAGITNICVGADHFSIVRSQAVTQGLASSASNACLQNSIKNMDTEQIDKPEEDNTIHTAMTSGEWKYSQGNIATLPSNE